MAYGHEAMSLETRNTLLYGQLHESLALCFMKASFVSSATDYNCLCVAAQNEEQYQAELLKRDPTRPPPSDNTPLYPLTPMFTNLHLAAPSSANYSHCPNRRQYAIQD